MKQLLPVILAVSAANVFAQATPVPHQFSNGNAIVASEFNANFQDLANRNNGTQQQVTQNAADIDALESSVAAVQGTATQNSGDISTLQSNVGDAQATTTQNASDITSVESSVSTVQGSVSQNASDIVTLNTNIASIDGTVTQIQSDLASLQSAGGGQPLLQFVGNSTGTVNGAQGIRTMTELCQLDYPESRVCTTEEYVKTINFPASIPSTEFSWIMPSGVVPSVSGGGLIEPYAGQLANEASGLNCDGWTQGGSTNRGIWVTGNGRLILAECEVIRPVSCCK